MSTLNLRNVPSGTQFDADLALVGAGPAGLALAREFSGTRLKLLLVESGGVDFDPEVQTLNRVENIGDPNARDAMPLQRGYTGDLTWLNDIPAFELRNRMVGGSTHTWVGKCAAFDDIDFDARKWVPDSGWPLQRRDLTDALDRAAALLNLGPNIYDRALYHRLASPPADIDLNDDLMRTFFWQSQPQDQRQRAAKVCRHCEGTDGREHRHSDPCNRHPHRALREWKKGRSTRCQKPFGEGSGDPGASDRAVRRGD
ncbi:hypothetical protein [Nitratireductor aquibiodomus]|uniref:hypothetical protein n=1 Tax=Nitratireductor aquibiodomus TaxID=204799 RepID=UPI001FCB9ADD|nr:hypothetical protein [Nitratireductor aquibiodomus]